ncbi:MAG: putative thioesterase superfamily protein [Nitrososphaeraceae archaeon]|nr:putative thioesterase superfamily protein [Nitrososphaeraceae archaeon]
MSFIVNVGATKERKVKINSNQTTSFLWEGENVKHLAATPIGTEVLLKSKVISVNGRRVMFDVEAFDKIEKIGQGQHERFIINVLKFKNKFDEKIKQLETT